MIRPDKGQYPLTQSFNDPCCRQTYKNAFGWTGHNGWDIGMPCGSAVYAPMGGVVFRGWEANGYGNYIFVRSGNLETVLGHLSSFAVAHGQSVSEGQLIAHSGSTGFSSGCHLHWGVRPLPANTNNGFGGYVDPAQYLTQTNNQEVVQDVVDTNFLNNIFVGILRRKEQPYDPVNKVWRDPGAKGWLGKPKDVFVQAVLESAEYQALNRRIASLESGGSPAVAATVLSKGLYEVK